MAHFEQISGSLSRRFFNMIPIIVNMVNIDGVDGDFDVLAGFRFVLTQISAGSVAYRTQFVGILLKRLLDLPIIILR